MRVVRKILTLLRVPKRCSSPHGHSWEFNWDMQPSLCLFCGLRHDDRFNRKEVE